MPNQNDGSRGRLLTAAERLFAERGIDAVSLREILRESGVKHATAIQYHFGGKDGLLSAVLEERYARVDTRRDAMLDQFEAEGGEDPRALAAILVRPLATELGDDRGRFFLQIYAQMVLRTKSPTSDDGSSIWRLRSLIQRLLPPDSPRLHPTFTALTFAMVELSRRASEPPHIDNRLFVSRLIDVVTAILRTTASAETQRLLGERDTTTGPKSGDEGRHAG
jgi:AcrR family transcriptional regulator